MLIGNISMISHVELPLCLHPDLMVNVVISMKLLPYLFM